MKSNFSLFFIISLLVCLFSSLGHADSVERLIEVTSDLYPGETFHVGVGTDSQGDIDSLVYDNGGGPVPYPLSQLRSGGVVLLHNPSPSRDVIVIKVGADFSAKDGGRVEIDYMLNGLTNPHGYGAFYMDLVRGGVTWLPYELDANGSRAADPMGHLNFVARKFLGRPVGVSYVRAW